MTNKINVKKGSFSNYTKIILDENQKILKFVNNWQLKNDYNPEFLDNYNKKFSSEFNDFLLNGNFTKVTIAVFKISNIRP